MSDTETPVLERLRTALIGGGVPFVHTTHEPVYTSVEAARVRGTSLHSGAKALIIKGKEGFLLAVIPADRSLDSPALRKIIRSKSLRFATKEEVLELTGLAPGSIPPFGSLFGLSTYCDNGLSENEHINFNAGSHSDSFQMTSDDFVRFEKPQMAQIAKPAAS